MNLSNSLRISLLAAVCGMASSLAFAADPPPEDILRGPDIQDRDVPGAPGTFGEAKNRGGKRPGAADQRQQQRAMMGALRSLEGEDVAPDLRLTADQQAQIKAIADELRAATEAFRAEHKDEIDALKAQAGEMRPRGGRDGDRAKGGRGAERPEGDRLKPMDAPGRAEAKADLDKRKADPDVAAAREKLKAIHAAAPKPEAYTTRMWAVLSAPQQALVQSRIDAVQDRERRDDDRRAMNRDRDRDRDRDGNRGKRADGRRGPRPAPSVDDVNVPPPPPDAPAPEVH